MFDFNKTDYQVLSGAERDHIMESGFAISVLAGNNNLKMIPSLSNLLQTNNSYINSTIKPLLHPGDNATQILVYLIDTLKNFPDDQDSHNRTVYFIIWLAVTVVFVAIRFAARKYITPKQIRREDWTCLAALVACCLMTAGLIVQNTIGHAGFHLWDLSVNNCKNTAKMIAIDVPIFYITSLIIRCNFLVFYYRLSPEKLYHRFVWGVGIYCTLISIPGVFIGPLACKPWDWWNHFLDHQCINRYAAFIAYSIQLIFSDVFILLLAIYPVLKLQLKTKDKLMLIGVFGLGGFIVVVSIFRTIALKTWLFNKDWTYALQDHAKWVVVEQDLSVIISCAPAIKILLFHRMPNSFTGISKLSFATDGLFRARTPSSKKSKEKLSLGSTLISGANIKATATTTVGSRSEAEGKGDIEMGFEQIHVGESTPDVRET